MKTASEFEWFEFNTETKTYQFSFGCKKKTTDRKNGPAQEPRIGAAFVSAGRGRTQAKLRSPSICTPPPARTVGGIASTTHSKTLNEAWYINHSFILFMSHVGLKEIVYLHLANFQCNFQCKFYSHFDSNFHSTQVTFSNKLYI